ncbi:MAG: MFS transporter [Clostridia bacterium]|nr:MFS transporter [Clostridia bacterium]
METVLEKDVYKTSRFLYILEAAFEYFISILVGGAYLAKVSAEIGLSDGLTGILTSFVSLGCGFQIIAIFLANKTPVKRWVTLLHSLNQLFFALIYLVPFIQISKTGKTVLFILFLLAGHIINNVVNSPKLNWFMSLVDDRQRGRFTANKEILSLLGGMIFSFVVGAIIDHFETLGDVNNAFIFCGFGVLGLTILHTLTLLFSKEKPIEKKEKVSIKQQLKELLKDRDLFKVILISVFWNISHYVATPFYGSYQIGALGFSMSFVAILSALYAVFRSLFSRPMGKYADKYSFAKMLNICFIIMVVAFAINTFTVPANGKIFYTAYYILYAIGMAGINSGEMNLIYDCVDREKRVGALALKSTLSGFAGFFTTLLVSPLVDKIQANGNTFLGLNVYAQQVVSALAMILTLALLIYLNTVVRKVQRKN